MKANPEDRVKAGAQSKRFPLPHLLVALGILAAVLLFSYSGSRDKPAPPIAVESGAHAGRERPATR